ncbi:MAG TPA: prepilin-type N-terminal cleavage/methylation domain-containing protein [Phycisphaerae bacterium]|nr:prepilin-type N-terminal cleavage/methylation domain-containing protein [Phycisphaerae bacterium]HRR83733.1 prepilin-type N-terminal cleavage/methylation domain-containing protein [Phycisphaerae bacterium]
MVARFQKRDGVRGFTLIEVLVVVAIIALLIAILLPSLARARAHARNAADLSNQHQIGLAMNMFASRNNGKVPVGADPDDQDHWVSIVAREIGLVKRLTSDMCVNHIRVDQIDLYQCAERTATGSAPFLGYVSNSLNPDGPSGTDWRPLDGVVNVASRYKTPANVIYIMCAETEPKVWDGKNSLGYLSPLGARKNWESAVAAGLLAPGREAQLKSTLINSGGGLDCLDIWRGGQLPQYNCPDIRQPNPNRRVAFELHLNRFTNAMFYDGHAGPVPAEKRSTWQENHRVWLQRCGLTPAGIAAALNIP